MLFSSLEYIFLFLPIVFFTYYILIRHKLIVGAKLFLIFASLFFYSYWNIKYLPLLLASVIINYLFGTTLLQKKNKFLVIIALIFNIGLLAYFKYANFLVDNFNLLLDTNNNIYLAQITLPLAISFFTFQQIAYIIDCYQNKLKDRNFLNYAIFVTFFPQLIAGPIVHHKEIMPQFKSFRTKFLNYNNIAMGIFIFCVGLFKKIIIADYFSIIVQDGFTNYQSLSLIDSWKTSISYSLQLYFDFSGYTDMAIGSALIFNIKLPFNFNQPYKSLNIKEFWQRWHMTLSNFLKSYVYIPLGGNKSKKIYLNLMIVFLISGIWHGAGWTFIFWGFLHGAAICLHNFYSKFGFKMPKILAWFLTFNFINCSWIFFRAENFSQAIVILQKMFAFNIENYGFDENWQLFLTFIRFNKIEYLFLVLSLFLFYKLWPIVTLDAQDLIKKFQPNNNFRLITTSLLTLSLLAYHRSSEFLYFNF